MQLYFQITGWLNLIVVVATGIVVLTWPRRRGKGWFVAGIVFGTLASLVYRILEFLDYDLPPETLDICFAIGSLGFLVHALCLLFATVSLRSVLQTIDSADVVTAPTPHAGADVSKFRDAMAPFRSGDTEIVAYFSHDGAATSSVRGPEHVRRKFCRELTRQFNRAGNQVVWQESAEGASLIIQLIEVDEGNQFLRYMIPFSSPAVVEIEGDFLTESDRKTFHMVRKAHFSLLGGAGGYMINVCASRLAAGMKKWILANA